MKGYVVVLVFEDGAEESKAIFYDEYSAEHYASTTMKLNKHWETKHGHLKQVDVREAYIEIGDVVYTVKRDEV